MNKFKDLLFKRKRKKNDLVSKEDLNSAYFRLFNTEDGKFVLDHLIMTNMLTPIAQQGDDILTIGVKQGRSNLIDEIIQRIDYIKNMEVSQ